MQRVKRGGGKAKKTSKGPASPKVPTAAQIARKARRQEKRKLRKAMPRTGIGKEITRAEMKNDARTIAPADAQVTLANAQEAVIVQQQMLVQSIVGVCVQYVTQALERGYLLQAFDPSYPYWALNYMYFIMQNYINAGQSPATDLPLWFLNLCQALSPKTVPFQLGSVTYSGALTVQDFSPPALEPMGPLAFANNNWNCYIPSLVTSDLFPVGQSPAGVPSDGGLAAWNSLCQFMADKKHGIVAANNQMVSAATVTPYKKNVSAFALPAIPEGGGFNTAGGWAYNAQSEVPIRTPVLSVFCGFGMIDQAADAIRYPVYSTSASGDPLWTAAYCSTAPPSMWGYKRYCRFHPVDFLQLGDVLAQFVSSLQTAYVNDPQYATAASAAIGGLIPSSYQCPITLQEMLLCLRNEVMNAFKHSQSGVQSMYPNTAISDSDNVFVPYTAGATTCAQGGLGMKLPLSFAENIRSLVMRHVRGSKPHDVLAWVPVLGQFSQFELSSDDYTFTYAGGSLTPATETNSFTATPPLERFKKDEKKGEYWEKDGVEPVISLISGYTSSPPGYVFINDQERLTSLIGLWNSWITNLDAFCDPLTTLATDTGVNILVSVCNTRHVIPLLSSRAAGYVARHKGLRDARLEKKKRLTTTPYSGFLVVAETFQGRPLQQVYESIMNTWVLPTNLIINGTTSSNLTEVQRWQFMEGEPFLVSKSSTGDDGVPMSEINGIYAAKMTHTRNAPKK